jgi:hypothetical protein
MLVVLNTAKSSQTLPDRPTLYPPGTRLVNLLDTSETAIVTAESRTPPITVPGTAAKIFIAQSQMLLLDPVVTRVRPAHDSTNAGTATTIVIQFSRPMDTRSVESAFSTIPAVTGSFAWSPAWDMLRFTPGGTGFPAQTQVSVRIAATARAAASGNAFYSAFESRFKTGRQAPGE